MTGTPRRRRLSKKRYRSRLSASGREFLSYKEASEFVKQQGIKTAQEYQDWAAGKKDSLPQRPENIPSCPHQEYAGDGWQGYGHFLGTGRVANMHRKFLPFSKARKFARRLQLQTATEWQEYSAGRLLGLTRPDNIPSNPQLTYKGKGWVNFADWLGNGKSGNHVESRFWDFETARAYARSLNLSSYTDWRDYVAGRLEEHGPRPYCLPSIPSARYKEEGWTNYADWLGYEINSPFHHSFLPYKEAAKLISKFELYTRKEYCALLDRDKALAKLLPRNPDKVYRDEGYGGLDRYLAGK